MHPTWRIFQFRHSRVLCRRRTKKRRQHWNRNPEIWRRKRNGGDTCPEAAEHGGALPQQLPAGHGPINSVRQRLATGSRGRQQKVRRVPGEAPLKPKMIRKSRPMLLHPLHANFKISFVFHRSGCTSWLSLPCTNLLQRPFISQLLHRTRYTILKTIHTLANEIW